MVSRLQLSLIAFSIAGLACACADPSGASADDDGDAVVEDERVDAALVAVTSPNKRDWICSGVVIAPRVVLTAAHCVVGGNTDKKGWSFEVFFGVDRDHAKPDDRTIAVRAFHFPKLYEQAVLGTGGEARRDAGDDADGDIAVLILAEPAKVKPVPWNARALDASALGRDVRIVGYGRDKPKSDPTSDSGLRKTFTTKVTRLWPGAVEIPPGRENPCHGDSGGPMLLDVNGVETVIGVGHVMFDEDCVSGANYERTDRYASFLEKAVDEAGSRE